MKRGICMLMGALLLAELPAQAWALEWEIRDVAHTVTAGQGKFLLDGREIDMPDGTSIYLKGGAMMLPAEPLLCALDEKAYVSRYDEALPPAIRFGDTVLTFEPKYNLAYATDTEVKLADGMEARDGQVYISMRGWRDIFAACGYIMGKDAVSWDVKTRTAKLCFTEQELEIIGEKEPPAPAGKGAAPKYILAPTQKYESIHNLGDGYFSAEKGSPKRGCDILDSIGAVRQSYDTHIGAEYLGENRFLLRDFRSDERKGTIVDENGAFVFSVANDKSIDYFSEGLAQIWQGGRLGFVDIEGRLAVPAIYSGAKDFSDGFALVARGKEHLKEWEYIDKNGKSLATAEYDSCQPFREGLAAVQDKEGKWGYIDTTGKEVIPPQYDWAGDFCGGKAFIRDESNGKSQTWTIDRMGKKLKLIAENKTLHPLSWDYGEMFAGMVCTSEYVTFAGGHETVTSIYDADGEMPYEKRYWIYECSEGLMAYRDTKTEKYGYVDEDWNWVIAPVFIYAGPFTDGYAAVATEVKQGDAVVDSAWGILQKP